MEKYAHSELKKVTPLTSKEIKDFLG